MQASAFCAASFTAFLYFSFALIWQIQTQSCDHQYCYSTAYKYYKSNVLATNIKQPKCGQELQIYLSDYKPKCLFHQKVCHCKQTKLSFSSVADEWKHE